MTNEQFDQWIAALESGEFKKGSGELYNSLDDAYCCLGVANKIFDLKSELDGFIRKFLGDCYFIDAEIQHRLGNVNDNSNTFGPVIQEIKMLKEQLVNE